MAGTEDGVIWPADMQEPTVVEHHQPPLIDADRGIRETSLYQGFFITPHSFSQDKAGFDEWSVGVFLRTLHQDPGENRYFRLRGIFAKSETDALQLGLRFGRYLIDQEVVTALEPIPGEAGRVWFRRSSHQSTWHFRPECSFWPRENYEERVDAALPLCNECVSKSAHSETA
jgi:hypothetical protein